MKQKLNNIQNNLKNNPEFQAKLQEIKPKRSIWGVLMVIFIFFVPELLSYLWSPEINEWVGEFVKERPTAIGDSLIWTTKKLFNGEVSWLNLGLGFAFFYWMFKR